MRWAWMVALLVVVGCSGGITTREDLRAELAGAGPGEAGASMGGAGSPAGGASAAATSGGDAGDDTRGGVSAGDGGGIAAGGAPGGAVVAGGGGRDAAGGAGATGGGDGTGGSGATEAGAGGVAAGQGGSDGGAGGCSLVYRVTYLDEPEIEFSCATAAGDWAYHGMCADGETDWVTVPEAPALEVGAVVVEAWTSVAVDETQPDTWPRLWVEGLDGEAKSVAGLPVSRLWFDVGATAAGVLTLRADQINGPDNTERDLNVDAVELWECAP